MLIYISAPLTKGNRNFNLRRAIDAADIIAIRGHTVFVPHLFELWELIHTHNYEFWVNQCFSFVNVCEIIVRLSGDSEGSDKEVALAKEKGKIIFGTSSLDGLKEFMNSSYWNII